MKNVITIALVILSAVLLRLFPHVPNFAPVGAMALFGGTYIGKKYALGIVLVTLVISDYLLLYVHPFSVQFFTFSHVYPLTALFHSTTLYVYGSFLLNIGIGMALRRHISVQNIALASITSSILFFLITNFGVWATGMYSRSTVGIWESFVMGIPFFRATVFGDLFYNGLFFGAYYIMIHTISSKKFALNH